MRKVFYKLKKFGAIEARHHHAFFDLAPKRLLGSIEPRLIRKNKYRLIRSSPFSSLQTNVVDHELKRIVFYSRKAGSSTIINFLSKNIPDLIRKSAINEKPIPYFILDSKNNLSKTNFQDGILNWENYKNYKKYIVFRDPFERVQSFYKQKLFVKFKTQSLLDTNDLFFKTCDYLNINIKSEKTLPISFSEFLSRLEGQVFKSTQRNWDRHLGPQFTSDLIELGMDDFTFINVHDINAFLTDWALKRGIHINESDIPVINKSFSYLNQNEKNELSTLIVKNPSNIKTHDVVRKIYLEDYHILESHSGWTQPNFAK